MLVRAAGGVLWRPGPDGPEVAVVHRPRYDDWSLPKGKLERGEHPLQGAVREVAEETGHAGVAGRALGTSGYPVLLDGRLVDKQVLWWSMRSLGGRFTPTGEVDALDWLPLDAARARLTAGRDDAVLDAFAAAPDAPDPLVLVRHARAGRRSEWDGPDDARPLDARGRAQAARLSLLLPLLGVRTLVTAPLARCRETLAPTAARLGGALVEEPALADEALLEAPDAAVALVRGLPPGTAVCGQGEGLPLLLERLGGDPGSGLRKGCAWVVSSGPGLLAVDPLDPEG